jgi:caffeoyl-CoA O-methyltransferase
MEEYGRTHAGAWSIPRNEAQFLNILTKLMKPDRILELGTSIGYSTVWIGLAAKSYGGKVYSIEIDREKVRNARENLKRAGLEDVVAVIHADANSIIPALKGRFGFVFMDSNKEDYLRQYKMFFSLVERGGAILADNAVDMAYAMMDYLEFVRNSGEVETVLLNIGNGIEFTRKI